VSRSCSSPATKRSGRASVGAQRRCCMSLTLDLWLNFTLFGVYAFYFILTIYKISILFILCVETLQNTVF
jgi:hypothetical protein